MNWSEEELNAYLKRRGQPSPVVTKTKKSKYNAEKTWIDGICFDSKLEGNFYLKLKQLLQAKEIAGFARQCRFVLNEGAGKENRAIEYVADFIVLYKNGNFEIIDTKGIETKEFSMKKKMFISKYPSLELKIEK